ncbi:MAG: prepilin-type N-terminal cleavage/methylation domain-containing protein [Desulfobacteraceae bacterium]|nr:prepilin-type N-terminal cleavage/methylation domain-containing protein [Desulfobacteraceae bacterium]
MMASQQGLSYCRRAKAQGGFSLIEVIITLLVGAILALVLASALGSSFTNSSLPLFRLQKTMALQQVMENIHADYAAHGDLALLKTTVGTGTQNNGYGVYTVISNKYIKFVNNVQADGTVSDGVLKISIQDPSTGIILTELFVSW